ncbi:hypothetical protein M8494_22730 [Serratia ureilytica]
MAEVLDGEAGDRQYQQVCDELVAAFDDPELTFSARILKAMQAGRHQTRRPAIGGAISQDAAGRAVGNP